MMPYTGNREGWEGTKKNGKKGVDSPPCLSYCPMTVMLLQINFKSGKPVYLQLVDQVKAAAAAGTAQAGEALPSIRPLAEELRVNRNTVAKAYTELESQGVIETIAGKGCFIKENNSPLKKEVRRKLLADEIDQVIVQAHHLQVAPGEFLGLVEARLEAMEQKRRANQAQLPERTKQ